MNARLSLLAAIAAAALFGWVSSLQASVINVPITNFSFETPSIGGPSGHFTQGTPPTGWSATTTVVGEEFYTTPTLPDGDQNAWFFGSTVTPQSLYQGTPAVLTSGDEYQLTAYLAPDVNTSNLTSTAALYAGDPTAGGTQLAFVTEVYTALHTGTAQAFVPVTVTFGPDTPGYDALVAAHPGASIFVVFTSSGTVSTDVDDVQLLQIVPEPASLGLLACGSLLMLRRRRA